MVEAIQQLALLNTLATNWPDIQLRMGSVSPALAVQLAQLAQRLQLAASTGDLARVVDDLLELTQDTAAESYVRQLVARSQLTGLFVGAPPPVMAPPPAAAPPFQLPKFAPRPSPAPAPAPAPPAPATLREINSAISRNVGSNEDAWLYAEKSSRDFGVLLSHTAEADQGVARVPIFFATNRKPDTKDSTTFLGDIGESLCYGFVPVTIPVAKHQMGQVETPSWWTLFPDKDKEHRFVTLGELQQLPPAAFLSKLETTLQSAEAKDLLVFLHGYNVTFEEAARRAAQIAYDMKFPGIVVLFSWPSLGALYRYTADEERAIASADRLAAFLKSLEGGPWNRVHILAHSMGNRVMLLGLADNPRPSLPLGECIFVAADVYVPVFSTKFPKLQLAGKLQATSYASKKDNALLLSDLLHKGDRVGLIRALPFTAPGLETVDATSVDHGFLGHGYFADQRSLLTDIGLLLRQGLGAKARGLSSTADYWAFPR